MKTKQFWLAVLAIGLTLTPRISVGQTAPVESSGTETQETQNPEQSISPEHKATKEQLARLLEAMRVREQAARAYQGVQIKLRQQLRDAVGNDNSKLPSEQRVALAKLLNQYSAKAANAYSVDQIVADLSTIYQRYLTQEDADAAIAFYTSKSGQDLLTAEPKIAGEAMRTLQQRAQEEGDVLTSELKKDLDMLRQQFTTSNTQSANSSKTK